MDVASIQLAFWSMAIFPGVMSFLHGFTAERYRVLLPLLSILSLSVAISLIIYDHLSRYDTVHVDRGNEQRNVEFFSDEIHENSRDHLTNELACPGPGSVFLLDGELTVCDWPWWTIILGDALAQSDENSVWGPLPWGGPNAGIATFILTVPDSTMHVGQIYQVTARIITDDPNVNVASSLSREIFGQLGDRVRISQVMMAELRGLSFKIDPPEKMEQALGEQTSWTWQVVPRSVDDDAVIEVGLYAIVSAEGRERPKLVRRYSKHIYISGSWSDTLGRAGKYAKMLADTTKDLQFIAISLLLPILGYFVGKRKTRLVSSKRRKDGKRSSRDRRKA